MSYVTLRLLLIHENNCSLPGFEPPTFGVTTRLKLNLKKGIWIMIETKQTWTCERKSFNIDIKLNLPYNLSTVYSIICMCMQHQAEREAGSLFSWKCKLNLTSHLSFSLLQLGNTYQGGAFTLYGGCRRICTFIRSPLIFLHFGSK